jgi:hypothetical protein
MTTLTIDGDRAVVTLTGLQAVMALARQVSVPLAAIRSVDVVPDGMAVDVGWRVGGTSIPFRLKFGRFRGNGRTFAALYADQPAVVIGTDADAPSVDWHRLVLALDDPDAAAASLRTAAGLPSALQ